MSEGPSLRSTRLARVLFWALFACLAALQLMPLFAAAGPLPLRETPSELAAARVWLSLTDARYAIAPNYDAQLLPVPGWLYVVALRGVAIALPLVDAHRVLLALYLLGTPLAFLAFAVAARRPLWQGLAGFCGLYCFVWSVGATAQLLSAIPFFWAARELVKQLDDSQRGARAGLAIALLLTVTLSWTTWLVLVCACLLLAIRPQPGLRRAVLLALGPSVAWMLSSLLVLADHPALYRLGERRTMQWAGVWPLLSGIPERIFDGIGSRNAEFWLGGMVLAALAMFVIGAMTSNARSVDPGRVIIRALLIATLVIYGALPVSITEPFSVELIGGGALLFLLPLVLVRPLARDRATMLALLPIVAIAVLAPAQACVTYRDRRPTAAYRLAAGTELGKRVCTIRPEARTSDPRNRLSTRGRSDFAALLPFVARGGEFPDGVMLASPIVITAHVQNPAPRWAETMRSGLRAEVLCDEYIIANALPGVEADTTIERVASEHPELDEPWARFSRRRTYEDQP